MPERIDITAGKILRPDGKPEGFVEAEPETAEIIVNDIQNINLPWGIEDLAIKVAIKIGEIIDSK